ncbi:UNVERIFIED_CONTAM: hypothetical protein K2H54_058817 [Gekko kuhli]
MGMQSQDLVAVALANALQMPVELQQYISDEIDAVHGPSHGTPWRQGGSNPQRCKAPTTTQQGDPNPKKKKADIVRTDEEAQMKKREMILEKERQALQVESEQLYNMIDQYACEAINRFNPYSYCSSTIMQVGGILPEQGSEVNESSESSPAPLSVNTDGVGGEVERCAASPHPSEVSSSPDRVGEEEEG